MRRQAREPRARSSSLLVPRPDLRRAEVLAFDEALYVCIDVHLHLDDLYGDLLERIGPTVLTSALDSLVHDGAVSAGADDVKEES